MFKESFKGVSRKVSRVFQGRLSGVPWDLFNEDSRELQGYLKEVQRVFQGSFKDALRKIQRC